MDTHQGRQTTAKITASRVEVEDLNLSYGKHLALKDVTIAFPDRQITCIIGPSGCGKSSLLRCLNRLIDLVDQAKVTGKVLVDGVDIYSSRSDLSSLRRKMGLLSQRPSPLPMSIYDNIAFGPRIHGVRRRKELGRIVEKTLQAVGLWDEVGTRLKAPASALSIGQQQRLCLARGLAVEPETLLADEPTSALDPASAKTIVDCFLSLKEQYTIIVVTHNLRRAKRLADYVAYLLLGELVEHGPAHQVLERPTDPRTMSYLAGDL